MRVSGFVVFNRVYCLSFLLIELNKLDCGMDASVFYLMNFVVEHDRFDKQMIMYGIVFFHKNNYRYNANIYLLKTNKSIVTS